MGLTVKVKFPDGVREMPAHVHIMSEGDDYCSFPLSVITPDDIDGWYFRRIIGGRDTEWLAFPLSMGRITGGSEAPSFASYGHFN